MNEIELIPEKLTKEDNNQKILMSDEEIWFVKHFIKKYNPKKIVEVGFFAGGNTVNLLHWKDKDAHLFSIDIATHLHTDFTKVSGWMVDESEIDDNFKIYRGYDYLDVYEEIGDDIDCIVIDTVHTMPGEFMTFLAALPQLKDGCVVILHDIHLNMLSFVIDKFTPYNIGAYCTGLLFGAVSSSKKWSLKTDRISNIGAFIIDEHTRENIKDVFHVLTATWHSFPEELDLEGYSEYINKNYPKECSDWFDICIKLQSKYFNNNSKIAQNCRIDVINANNRNSAVEILEVSDNVNISFPNWFESNIGKGMVVESELKSFNFVIKCVGDGSLRINLRGPDVRNHLGSRIPSYVNYNSLEVNRKNLFRKKIRVWHDMPFTFEKKVKNGEILHISVNWSN